MDATHHEKNLIEHMTKCMGARMEEGFAGIFGISSSQSLSSNSHIIWVCDCACTLDGVKIGLDYVTRSLGALPAPTSSRQTFGPTLGPLGLFT